MRLSIEQTYEDSDTQYVESYVGMCRAKRGSGIDSRCMRDIGLMDRRVGQSRLREIFLDSRLWWHDIGCLLPPSRAAAAAPRLSRIAVEGVIAP